MFLELLSHVQLFATPSIASSQVSWSFTISWSLLKLMSIESVMLYNRLILCHPFLLPSNLPIIRVFSSELVLHIRWPKYWSFSFSVSPSSESRLMSQNNNLSGSGCQVLVQRWGGVEEVKTIILQISPGVGDGQGILGYCHPWGRKESDIDEQLN